MLRRFEHKLSDSLKRLVRAACSSTLAATLVVNPFVNAANAGTISNTAEVTATLPSGISLTSAPSTEFVMTDTAAPSYTMIKSAILVDGDGDGLGDVGETINYTFRFTNTGNMTLADLSVSDPLPGLSAIVCAPDIDTDGDIDALAPLATATCTASYTIVQGDVDAGSVTNAATSAANVQASGVPVVEDDAANDNSTTTNMDNNPLLTITKTATAPVEVFPYVYDITYNIAITNAGTASQTNITLQDDLSAALPVGATLLTTPGLTIAGFSGTGGQNAGYDGVADIQIFTGDVQLSPGDTGTVQIDLRIEIAGSSNSVNTAFVDSDQTGPPIASDDPNETPGDPTDTNPTPVIIDDSDNDGADDSKESVTADRDGDGIPDAQDYDPTGYLYCEDNGRVLTGGLISVQNIGTGGVQTGIGNSNNITIVQDGSTGFYQFYVSAPGQYRLILTTTPSGAGLSTTRLPGAILDVSSLLPGNPAIIGSGVGGVPTTLIDSSASGNPYYFEFDIEAGDPTIFNNNIPFQLCGQPVLDVSKTVTSGPTVVGTANEITYQVTLQNTGTLRAETVQLTDDLAGVFGAGNVTVTAISLDAAPATFGATENTGYDGDGDRSLLTNGGVLQPGETVVVSFTIQTTAPAGDYINSVTASGTHPGTGAALTEPNSLASITITNFTVNGLRISKIAGLTDAFLGQVVPYEIRVSNPDATARTGVDIVDRLPAGMTYVPGTSTVDGLSVDPQLRGLELVWPGQTIPALGEVRILLSVRISAAASGTEFTNSAFVGDPVTGALISNVARATVRLKIEPVLQCSDLIGRVFDDLDGDGYHDDGEPGLAGVRLATVNGELITTDQFGRFHIACGAIPDGQIGSNYILKLDPGTLPTGYQLTSENPRVVRLTRGKLAKINFAASLVQNVSLGLDENSFVPGSTRLTRQALLEIRGLFPILERRRTLLEIIYRRESDSENLGNQRLEATKSLIEAAWKARERRYQLKFKLRHLKNQP